ncbi:hypothetical protein R1sor_004293 [Riccia sorocarpa]|uniref:Reverse transcriptase domain-containing protein n=1 Tax=Riccia sorocarpa TaxID=122646 RepID=A0ABD3HJS4_9MARC
MLKSKFKREALDTITTDQGVVLTAREDILAETQRFYQDLFSEEEEDVALKETTLQEGLSLIKKRINLHQVALLEKVHDMEEIEKIVELLPSEKSPGLDGVTSEAVREMWPWIRKDCLVENASSVVHLNGSFTAEVQLQRGVRQGCPIAPMLFMLSTQPLMELLRSAQIRGHIQGLEAGSGKHVLEALFADDTGLLLEADEVNWRKATEIIHKFEIMSGARLNASKSLVIPVGFSEPPDWLIRTGCKLALEGEVWSYLGCPIGIDLTEEQVMQWILDRLTKRLNHWTNRMLTEGAEKKAMVAWSKLCAAKGDGGLGLQGFDTQAKALKLKLVAKILNQADLDWVYLLRSIVQWKILDTRSRHKEIGSTLEYILLTGRKLDLRSTPTAAKLLQGWWDVRKFLSLKPDAKLPDLLEVEVALRLTLEPNTYKETVLRAYLKMQRKASVERLKDLSVETLDRLDRLEIAGGDPRASDDMEGPVSFFSWWLRLRGLGRIKPGGLLADPDLWNWKKAGKSFQGWDLTSAQWKLLLAKETNLHDKLNSRWGLSWEPEKWQTFWNTLWRSDLFLRDKTWLWRVIHNGLCVGSRLMKMGVTDGLCPGCGAATESVQHCLLDCEVISWRWWRMIYLLNVVQPEHIRYNNLIVYLDSALQNSNLQLTMLLMAVSQTRIAWRNRCDRIFNRRRTTAPTYTAISNAVAIGNEIIVALTSGQRQNKAKAGTAYLELMQTQEDNDRRRRTFDEERLEHDNSSLQSADLFLQVSTSQISQDLETESETNERPHTRYSNVNSEECIDLALARLGFSSGTE